MAVVGTRITFEQSTVMRNIQLTAHIERDLETGLYIGMVPSIPGAHTQARSLDELQANLKEVVELCFEEMTKEEIEALPEFVGLQSFSIAV
jgi:predicted RNase H-like HicB family nuclease